MRTDGRRELRRPVGALLRPLGFLVFAIAGGFGMWHALVEDGLAHRTTIRQDSRHPHVVSPRP